MKFIHNKQKLETKLQEFQIEQIFNVEKSLPFTLQQYEPDEIILLEGSELESLLFLV